MSVWTPLPIVVIVFLVPALPNHGQTPPVKWDGALTRPDLFELLAGQVPPTRLAAIVRSCDVTFEFSSALEADLRAVGADDSVIAAVRKEAMPAEERPRGEIPGGKLFTAGGWACYRPTHQNAVCFWFGERPTEAIAIEAGSTGYLSWLHQGVESLLFRACS